MKNSNNPKLILELCIIQNTVNDMTKSEVRETDKKEKIIEK